MTNVRLVKTGIQDVFARIRIMKTSAEKAVLRGYAVDHNGVRCNNCRELQHFLNALTRVWLLPCNPLPVELLLSTEV